MRISEDKKTIVLDVPIGGKVFFYNTRCNDLCTYARKKLMESFPNAFCDESSICHTVPIGVTPIIVTLEKIPFIVRHWKRSIFPTEQEATDAMNRVCKERIQKLREADIEMDDGGNYIGERQKDNEDGV